MRGQATGPNLLTTIPDTEAADGRPLTITMGSTWEVRPLEIRFPHTFQSLGWTREFHTADVST